MCAYDYGNARLRAIKSRFLTRRELESLAEAGSVRAMIAALARTTYRQPIEEALARASGMECISEALRRDLTDCLRRISRFYNETAAERIAVVLRSYDIYNIKTILRGLAHHVPPGEITLALLPVGELDSGILASLVRAVDIREMIDLLASMRLTVAEPLLRLRAERPGAEPFEMELALDRWYFQEAFRHVDRSPASGDLLAAALRLEADLVNMLTVLRLIHAPATRPLLRQRLGVDDVRRLFVGPGHLSFDLLARVASEGRLESMVEVVTGTPYEAPLRAGLQAQAQAGRLSAIERELGRFRLHQLKRMIVQDPLGIGVVLGFIALKINEVSNIRRVAQGIDLGHSASMIRQEMEFAA